MATESSVLNFSSKRLRILPPAFFIDISDTRIHFSQPDTRWPASEPFLRITPARGRNAKVALPYESASAPKEKKLLLSSTDVVIGTVEDPCTPFDPRMQRTLRVLERLAHGRPHSLTINTRSPLIVLALPVLKALGRSLTVTFALEAADDAFHHVLFPDLPRPSERLSAARALQNFGIRVELQVSPFITERNAREEAAKYASSLKDLHCPLTIFSPAKILLEGSKSRPLRHLPPGSAEAPAAASHQLLYCALQEIRGRTGNVSHAEAA